MSLDEFRRLMLWLTTFPRWVCSNHTEWAVGYIFWCFITFVCIGMPMETNSTGAGWVAYALAPSLTPWVIVALNAPILYARNRVPRKQRRLQQLHIDVARLEKELKFNDD